MDRKLKKYLEDIRLAIEDIESFLAQRPRIYSVFLEDSMFRRAIEREIGIIGEAMNQILKFDTNISITDARKIVGTRNYVIHAYDTLRPDMIWDIVINDIPILKEEVNTLLSEN